MGMGNVKTYTIPASSSPWGSSVGNNAELVHYATNETNGAYYTWCAATASKGRYCTGATTTVDDSEYSICPRGWKLPSLSEYQNFLTKAGINYQYYNGSSWSGSSSASDSTKIRGAPYNFPYAGVVLNGSLQGVGSNGYYWSSTANDSNLAYCLGFNSSNVYTDNRSRYSGFSVRCIAP